MGDAKIELKPCPFCGMLPKVHKSQYIGQEREDLPLDGWGWRIWCANNDCDLWPSTREEATLEKAAAKWNRRA